MTENKSTIQTAAGVPERERAVLVAVVRDSQELRQSEEYLDELEFLAETADITTVRRFSQRLPQPSSRIYVGPGKLEEIAAYCEEHAVDVAIFDDELTPAQTRNIERAMPCRILDRIADEIVGYNVAFDIGFLKAAGATINPDAAIIDTMQEFMDAFGNSNTGHRYQPLSMAAERLGYNWTSAPHGSLSDTLACLAAQKCVDDHNWCVENLELTEDAIMHAKPIENGSEGLPKDCWDLNPGGRPFAVTEPILHRLQSSAKLCARAGTTTQFTRMTVNQWFDKAERSQRSPLGRSVDIGRAASALNSQHEHAEVPQDLTK